MEFAAEFISLIGQEFDDEQVMAKSVCELVSKKINYGGEMFQQFEYENIYIAYYVNILSHLIIIIDNKMMLFTKLYFYSVNYSIIEDKDALFTLIKNRINTLVTTFMNGSPIDNIYEVVKNVDNRWLLSSNRNKSARN